MKKKSFLPMDLQFFAESAPAGGAAAGSGQGAAGASQTSQSGGPDGAGVPGFDYDKLASLIQGKQTVAEDTVLKNYFKQQGLSQEEASQAIAAFKQQKAAQQPDIAAVQAQLTQAQTAMQQAQAAALQAQIQSAATMAAVSLGIEAKTIPYVLKMADLSQVVGQDGKINEETIKSALNTVLEAVPALKPQAAGTAGFIQVGASGGSAASATDDELDRIFGVKKK